MIDTHDLKARVDLLELIGGDTRLKRIASTRGGEYAGPCPFCGGTDRLRVQPEQGLWWCRSCSDSDRWQDAIGYVMRRDGVPFAEAVRTLGGEDRVRKTTVRHPAPAAAPPPPPPSRLWQQRAEAITREAVDTLWSDRGTRARDYLHARGLEDSTLRRFVVGYIPEDRRDDPTLWGLETAAGAHVWLPRGILLPWIMKDDDEVWAVKIRRPDPIRPKYHAVHGSVLTLFGSLRLKERKTLVLAEGEFDAMLAWQAAGDLVDVASLGSASKGIDPRAAMYLLGATRIFVALDADKAGETGAVKLLASSPRMRRIDVPAGQDLTDYAVGGGDVRALVAEAVS